MNRKLRRAASKAHRQLCGTPVSELLRQAMKNHQEGRLAEAETSYRAILRRAPHQPDACHFLGVLLHQTGRSAQAIESIRRAIAQVPSYIDAYNNLGNVYKETGEMEQAVAAYRKVIEHSPQHSSALNNLGVALKELGEHEEAIRFLQRAIAHEPQRADYLHNLGNAYRRQGELQKSAEAFRQSIALQPIQSNAYEGLCQTLYLAGNFAEAEAVLRQWLALDPDNPVAKHKYAVFATEVPERASDDYVQLTFDNFAGNFEQVLARLEYRAPELVAQAVAAILPPPAMDKVILDAGCGTGLCAPLLRPYAAKLVGVDLSPKMLAKAAGRDLYEELIAAELVNYIGNNPSSFDLIVATDTLVYFGDLSHFLQAAKHSLCAGGHLVFTLEQKDSGTGFTLNFHGRYSHTRTYVESVLAETGFRICSIAHETLRLETGNPVAGLVVTAASLPC